VDGGGTLLIDPYTGSLLGDGSNGVRAVFRVIEGGHRWLGLGASVYRAAGRAVTGVCNLAFLFLILSGLYLWWPRRWTPRPLKSVALFNRRLHGKFMVDNGGSRRPDGRSRLELDLKSGAVIQWQPYASNAPGRKLLSWIRAVHTGEAGGVIGQVIAMLASAGAVVLVWTGLSLTLRRFRAWRARGRRADVPTPGTAS
jgi:uncharacterized iron-regulated membrane protein